MTGSSNKKLLCIISSLLLLGGCKFGLEKSGVSEGASDIAEMSCMADATPQMIEMGIIEALKPNPTAAGYQNGETAEGHFSSDGDTSGGLYNNFGNQEPMTPFGTDPGASAPMLLLNSGEHVKLQVIVGADVIQEVLEEAGRSAAHGGSPKLSGSDAQRLKAQAISIRDQLNEILRSQNARVHVEFVYSYNYVWNEAKRRYADPLVFGYTGAFHRIVHARYSRCKGVVYRIVAQKVTEAVNMMINMAQRELSALSTDRIRMTIVQSHQAGISVGHTSMASLYRNGSKIGPTVTYQQIKPIMKDMTHLGEALDAKDLGGAVDAGSSAINKISDTLSRVPCRCRHSNGHCMIFRIDRSAPGNDRALAWKVTSSCSRQLCDELRLDFNVGVTCSDVEYHLD